MPELPKRLLPKREEDHKIELESGAKPPLWGHIGWHPELEELKRQLKELLDARFIQPSKAPYGVERTSILFHSSLTCLINLVPQLGSFIGLINYWRFIKGYSTRAVPLTDLLKKNKTWEWDERCQQAFEDLKKVVVRSRCWHYPTIPRVLRHYLLGSHFIKKTDNVATSYFQTQKKLSPKQVRWQDFLAEFNYTLEYKPGSANHVADALSRKNCNMIQWLRASSPWPMKGRLSGFGWRTTYSTLRGDDSTCLNGEHKAQYD
ncbi:hypothetical protein AAG906_035242 [Vitis piasezkii]